jgi:serine/threonine-protein kinase CTR1
VYRDLDDLAAKEEEIDLGKKIGSGASSEVFYGNFKFCPCAVKKIKMTMMNAKQINFIINEIACLKKLRHPNIVMIIGVLIDQEDNLMIITELCEQESIKKFLTKFQKKAPLNVKMRILFDIAKAIYYMHESEPQIVHRDLKPENIFLTADLKAKIGDFG